MKPGVSRLTPGVHLVITSHHFFCSRFSLPRPALMVVFWACIIYAFMWMYTNVCVSGPICHIISTTAFLLCLCASKWLGHRQGSPLSMAVWAQSTVGMRVSRGCWGLHGVSVQPKTASRKYVCTQTWSQDAYITLCFRYVLCCKVSHSFSSCLQGLSCFPSRFMSNCAVQ